MNEMMSAGVEIMLVGMGTVFLFLAMLIVAVNLMSKTIQRFSSQEISNPVFEHQIDPSIIAAISTAVHHYRNKNTP
jgi:oxaloacetate decarboxylase gamma subunit